MPTHKLYLVHCGFYDTNLCDGVYEGHVNFFVAAETFEEARAKARLVPDFKTHRMHIDGLQEISLVDGFQIMLEADPARAGQTVLVNQKHRDLATPTTKPL